MEKVPPTYLAYLLRLRRVYDAGQPVCRISLETPGGDPPLQFENLPALYEYLAAQIRVIAENGGDVDGMSRPPQGPG